MSVDRASIVRNMVDYCRDSPKKAAILRAVKKAKTYAELGKELKVGPTYCSGILNRMKSLGLVESVEGRRGYFRQTEIMRTVNIESELRRSGQPSAPSKSVESEMVKEVVRIFEIEKAADFLDLNSTIRNNCFPPKKPYRKDVGEAYLALETVIRQEADLPRGLVGSKLVSAAAEKGLFNREVESEKNGLIQLYMGAFGWFRNVYHHTVEETTKEEAIKMILFADYLIKLVRKLKEDNHII